MTQLRWLADEVRDVIRIADLRAHDIVQYYSIPAFDALGGPRLESADRIESDKLLVRAGDVLVSKLNPRKSRVQVVNHHEHLAVASTEFVVLRPRKIDPSYLVYLLRSESSRQALDARVQSVTRSQQRVDPADVMRLAVPILDAGEQASVAGFLDRETALIAQLIMDKERMLDELTELWRAELDEYLHRAPTARTFRLRDLLLSPPCYGVLVPEFVNADGVPFVRVGDLESLSDRAAGLVQITTEQAREYRRTTLAPGDVLASVVGSIDKVAVVPAALRGANIARAVARLQPRRDLPAPLLAAAIESSQYQRQAREVTSADTAQPTLNMGHLAKFRLVLPADTGERALLARRIDQRRSEFDRVARETRESVGGALAYRDSIVEEAVTGRHPAPSSAGLLSSHVNPYSKALV